MHLIVITAGSYPYGGAYTNRHLSYLKGLAKHGVKVTMLILHPDKNQSFKSNNAMGIFNGITYEYMYWSLTYKKNLFNKIKIKLISHYKSVIQIKNIVSNDLNSRILVLSARFLDIIIYLIISKIFKIKIFHERTEFPFLTMNTYFRKIELWIYLNGLIPKFDGLFVISKALVKYFKKYNKRILHLPMTVEYERFTECKEIHTEFKPYIAYCGSMYTNKDGVPYLIEAFNTICGKNYAVNLLLIGDNSDETKFKYIRDCIEASPYKQRIICTGQIDRDEIPKYLSSAEILALARPDNVQAKGGFPTKLGEYLATGKPVVITDVGEHTDYLTDGISAFIAPPDDPVAFSEKLIEVLENPGLAERVGKAGRKVALSSFNYMIQAEHLYNFIQ